MTADVINLRRARKDKARKDKDRVAAANRASFGRTKSERERADADRGKIARALDQARIEQPAKPIDVEAMASDRERDRS